MRDRGNGKLTGLASGRWLVEQLKFAVAVIADEAASCHQPGRKFVNRLEYQCSAATVVNTFS
jgi:hypothetical protein